jgi:hypothetical protein
MQKLTNVSSKAWISLLWAQYNKLSEPLKEVVVNLAHNMVEETGSQKGNAETSKPTEGRYNKLKRLVIPQEE